MTPKEEHILLSTVLTSREERYTQLFNLSTHDWYWYCPDPDITRKYECVIRHVWIHRNIRYATHKEAIVSYLEHFLSLDMNNPRPQKIWCEILVHEPPAVLDTQLTYLLIP